MEQHVSEQYDEQDVLSVQATEGETADVEQTEDQTEDQVTEAIEDAVEAAETDDSAEAGTGLEPGQSPAPELEDLYGEPDEGPDVEDDPRLDTEVTDESTDLA